MSGSATVNLAPLGTHRLQVQAVLWLLLALLTTTAAATAPQGSKAYQAARERAERAWSSAREALAKAPNPGPAQLAQVGRTCFELAEFAVDREERERLAEEGIAACRKLMEQAPGQAAGPYWLAMNKGQLARTRLLGALRLVAEMERLFHQAEKLDPTLDYHGPDRCLGLLYLQAPRWPASVGNRTKAREHLLSAVNGSPQFPENWVCALEGFDQGGDLAEFSKLLKNYRSREPELRKAFPAPEWAWYWEHWAERLNALRSIPPPASPSR